MLNGLVAVKVACSFFVNQFNTASLKSSKTQFQFQYELNLAQGSPSFFFFFIQLMRGHNYQEHYGIINSIKLFDKFQHDRGLSRPFLPFTYASFSPAVTTVTYKAKCLSDMQGKVLHVSNLVYWLFYALA